MEQFAAMGANRIEVSVYAYTYDEDGNSISKDYFTGLYRFCSGLKESIIGITPKGSSNATVVSFPTPLPGCWGIRPPQNFW